MSIQVLPPQLANQIAAGEVVERPASVVKELVENSLDAGASKVEIDIERGGRKAIVIRDNGKGIGKEEIALALARHATSKVATLEDLESILSFGFRGEALASISSVARLTLSSRTEDASEAWQAYAEGRDMAVKVQPTAHPVGTTLEVVDLFFNTPARRRFLRADKTEFTHIEEQLRRIALAKETIHFSLRHNGKLVRQYRPARNDRQRQQRLASICGNAFAERAIMLRSANDDMALTGFVALDDDQARVSDVQYFYVNGRVVRDKLVNHAVRQALEEAGVAQAAGFVLYLTLDPHEVDVNVHPAKHEVRFHQARYVHDFILTALQQGIRNRTELTLTPSADPVDDDRDERSLESTPAATSPPASVRPISTDSTATRLGEAAGQYQAQPTAYGSGRGGSGYAPPPLRSSSARSPAAAASNYGELLRTPETQSAPSSNLESSDWQLLTQLDKQTVLFGRRDELKLVPLAQLQQVAEQQRLLQRLPQGLVGQPLLLPVSLPAEVNWVTVIEQQQRLLRQLGIDLSKQHQRLVLKTVPAVLRHGDLAQIIAELLQWLETDTPSEQALAAWLAQWGSVSEAAPQLWAALDKPQQDSLLAKAIPLPWQSHLE